jgi:hypothetical protein
MKIKIFLKLQEEHIFQFYTKVNNKKQLNKNKNKNLYNKNKNNKKKKKNKKKNNKNKIIKIMK